MVGEALRHANAKRIKKTQQGKSMTEQLGQLGDCLNKVVQEMQLNNLRGEAEQRD